MAVLKVGDRVRIIRSPSFPELVGTEGTVLGELSPKWSFLLDEDWLGYEVAPDVWGSSRTPTGGRYGPPADCLEPIQPERNQVIEWSECLWQPENIGEPA